MSKSKERNKLLEFSTSTVWKRMVRGLDDYSINELYWKFVREGKISNDISTQQMTINDFM